MSKRAKIITGAVVAIVGVAVAAVVWWSVRGAEPEAVDLGAAVAQLETAASDMSEAAPAAAEPAEDVGTDAGAGSNDPDVASGTVAGEDASSTGAGGEAETATAESGHSEGGERAGELAEDVVAAAAEGSEESVGNSEVVATDDDASQSAGGETGTAAEESGPGDGGTEDAPEPEEVVTAAGEGAEDSDAPSEPTPADDAPSITTGDTEPEEGDAAASGLAGIWKMVTAEGADAMAGEGAVSFAGFRVQEVLAGGIGENTAVGRTEDVSGYIELSEEALLVTKVIVGMGTLRTDDSHRDHHMRESLNTEEFPLAAFTLVESVDLPAGSSEGEPFSGSARGDLTIKGVTNRVSFDLNAQLVGDVIVVVGSAEVVFSDYGVPTPRSAAVISVEDHGVMEFQLYFAR